MNNPAREEILARMAEIIEQRRTILSVLNRQNESIAQLQKELRGVWSIASASAPSSRSHHRKTRPKPTPGKPRLVTAAASRKAA